jgi:hypothetical protein
MLPERKRTGIAIVYHPSSSFGRFSLFGFRRPLALWVEFLENSAKFLKFFPGERQNVKIGRLCVKMG